ncbi:MAG: tRNA lysidine(34) synthetase TilS [Acidobacteria bacterium]|nr:tRNA lysidine(34) synthetase TilS [Acidobacteriota bacterium]
MSTVADLVQASIARHKMVRAGAKVLVACSGGPDSTGLLHIMRELGVAVSVAHFNHRLRGDESERDQEFVRDLAASLELELSTAGADVAAEARARRMNLEDCARRMRMDFLRETARRTGALHIALGHTLDDLVETFFMKLIRGTGRTGLTSIAPVRGPVIRPLIELRKQEIVAYLEERRLKYVVDSSNADLRFLRNRIRAEMLPVLERISGRVVGRIGTAVAVLRREEALMQGLAREAFAACRQPAPTGSVALSSADLSGLHPAIVARVLRLALAELGSRADYAALEGLLDWCLARNAAPRFATPLRGAVLAERCRAVVDLRSSPRVPPHFQYDLPIPGSVLIHETSDCIETRILDAAGFPDRGAIDDNQVCYLDASRSQLGLEVRNRVDGDAYRPLGARHTRKVKKMLIDRKIHGAQKLNLPVILSAGRICWVPGLPVSEDFKVTPDTKQILEIKRLPS